MYGSCCDMYICTLAYAARRAAGLVACWPASSSLSSVASRYPGSFSSVLAAAEVKNGECGTVHACPSPCLIVEPAPERQQVLPSVGWRYRIDHDQRRVATDLAHPSVDNSA